jgi:hypothetical protein
MDNYNNADLISYQACDLYNKKPAEIEGSFTMYSHSRFASLMIHGIAEQLFDEGCTEKQVKEVLASKSVRWMLDKNEDELINFGKELAKEYELGAAAKNLTPFEGV